MVRALLSNAFTFASQTIITLLGQRAVGCTADLSTKGKRVNDITIIFLIIAVAVVLFVANKLPVVVVAMAVGLSLWASGLLSLPDALAGYGDPAVMFIAELGVIVLLLQIGLETRLADLIKVGPRALAPGRVDHKL